MDKQTVLKIGKLSRIRIQESETDHYAKEISSILDWVEQLQEVNTDDVPQLSSVADVTLPFREDKVTDGHQQKDVLANAPKADHGCFAVPKVIE